MYLRIIVKFYTICAEISQTLKDAEIFFSMTNKCSIDYLETIMEKVYDDEKLSPRAERFNSLIEKRKNLDDPLGRCLTCMEEICQSQQVQLFYFGGLLRDLWLGFEPRDVDIVSHHSMDALNDAFSGHPLSYNRFGGMKLFIEGINVDLWKVEDTHYFKENDFPLPCIHLLPNTVFFNLESIVYEVHGGDGYRLGWENGFFEGCENKTIDSISQVNPFPELQLARTYHLHEKLNWNLGENLKKYIQSTLPGCDKEKIHREYVSRYGTILSLNRIVSGLDELSN